MTSPRVSKRRKLLYYQLSKDWIQSISIYLINERGIGMPLVIELSKDISALWRSFQDCHLWEYGKSFGSQMGPQKSMFSIGTLCMEISSQPTIFKRKGYKLPHGVLFANKMQKKWHFFIEFQYTQMVWNHAYVDIKSHQVLPTNWKALLTHGWS